MSDLNRRDGWRALFSTIALLCALASAQATAQPARKPAATTAATAAPQRAVLVMGDSLSAAYGLSAAQGWVSLTAQKIAKEKPGWRVVNASISGETSAGGAARIAAELKRQKPSVVVIELGANDGLRGLPLAQTRANLARMIAAAKAANAKVLLIGMRLPPNYGPDYLPFLLQPLAMHDSAFQADRLHPVASAQPKLRDHVWPALAPLLK